MGAGRTRFSWGPLSTKIFPTTRSSTSRCACFCSALATADFKVFRMSRAATLLVWRKIATASLTGLPRTMSATRRIFCAEPFMYRSVAVAFIAVFLYPLSPCPGRPRRRRRRPGSAWCARCSRSCSGNAGSTRCNGGSRFERLLPAVSLEDPSGRELPEFMSDHVLGDVDGDEFAPVVDRDRMPDHVGNDRGTARPGLDDLLFTSRVQLGHLLGQVVIDERALFDRTSHIAFP